MITLYTFGYLNSRAERIISELIALKTPIVDIRFNADSKNWRYTQTAFMHRPGISYYYIKALGNEWYKEALANKHEKPHVKLHDEQTGLIELRSILDRHGKAAIFCACANKTTCHRITVANLAHEQLGVKVVHL